MDLSYLHTDKSSQNATTNENVRISIVSTCRFYCFLFLVSIRTVDHQKFI